ncbi:MAG TPA: hypothetical protein VES42_29605 [Pilimelia sp.]|nr:hypothetical protein [Pilimelia sp.]
MAIVHQAQLKPTKLELLAPWLPDRPWFPAPAAAELERVAAYRFDDPAGEVGVETLLVRAGDGPLLHVPLTYRGAPLDGHDRWLLGTLEHSVLGRRWVYDGCGDPVYVGALAHAILTGGEQAEEFVDAAGQLERREPGATVRGSGVRAGDLTPVGAVLRVDDGDPTVVVTDTLELSVVRVLPDADADADADGDGEGGGPPVLTGTWTGRSTPVRLASARTA